MRMRLVGVIVVFTVVGVGLVATLFGPGLLLAKVQDANLPILQATPVPGGNAIERENAQAGTSNWKIPGGKESSTQIQAYANATSVAAGQRLTFYVSTQQEGIYYSIGIYRLGWYAGLGGRLMTWQGGLVGHVQGYYDLPIRKLKDCLSCRVDTHTGLVEANWKSSYSLVVPPDWTTGVYLAKLTDARGMQTYVPFDVRGNFHSSYIAVTSDTTYQAYNTWGDYSLYDAENTVPIGESISVPRAVQVSFDRPYTEDQQGAGQVLAFELDAIRWMERQGYDLSYISSIDLDENSSQLLNHRAYISLGHDEYWTKAMRDGIEQARDRGVGLAFFGADDGYWQMRFEPNSAGVPDRIIVCYKVASVAHNLADDPLYGKDNTLLTAQWRDPVLARPENALIGVMFSGLVGSQAGFPWQVSFQVHSKLLDGTGLVPGQRYSCFPVGYEWDRIFANGASPPGLQVLGSSPTVNASSAPDVSNTTYYIASSGAMVFATGSINWTTALDSYRADDNVCPQGFVVPGMQKLMAKVMDALIVHHPLL